MTSAGLGDTGRLAAGVDPPAALLILRSFFCFLFLPMIGATSSTFGSNLAAAASSTDFSSSLLTSLRCFLCLLLVVALTGAEPTLDGGGEFALDIEVDVTEALSDIISLVGVPGRSCLDIDARLGCRDGGNCGNADVTELGVALPAAGVSGFMEEAIRNVLGAFVDIGD